MEFASPTMLLVGGALAVLIPVLIQLFNRTRFQITQWAAMEFLLAALKKTRKRVRLENLLLLLLRILVLAFVALMLARPSIEGSVPLPQKTHLVVVLDNSYSTGARTDGREAFERAKDLIEASINAPEFVDGSAISLFLTSETLADYGRDDDERTRDEDDEGDETDDVDVEYDPEQEEVALRRIRDLRAQLEAARETLDAAEEAYEEERGRDTPQSQRLARLQEEIDEAQAEIEIYTRRLADSQAELIQLRQGAPDTAPRGDDGDVRIDPAALSTTERETVMRKLRDAELSLVPADWGITFSLVEKALESSAEAFESKQVVVVTDMQAINFPEAEDSEDVDAYRDQLEGIVEAAGGTSSGLVRFVDVGGFALNRTLVDVQPSDHVVGVGVPIKLTVTVANYSRMEGTGTAAQNTFRLRYSIDGGRERDLPPIEDVRPGQTRTVELADALPPFNTPGTYVIEVMVDEDDDDLPVDNRRAFVIEVRDAIEVLAVDGSPGRNPVESELFYFNLAVPFVSNLEELRNDPSYVPKTVVRARSTTVDNIVGINFYDYDVVLLANVQAMPPSTVSQLARYVEAGGSVVVTLGRHIDRLFYNETMFQSGLMPVRVGEPIFPPENESAVSIEPVRPWHRSVADMAEHDEMDPNAQQLTPVRVYQAWGVEWPEVERRELRRIVDLMREDESGRPHPLLFGSRLGRGEVVVYTSPLDGRWRQHDPFERGNNFMATRSYVKFWHEMLYALADTGSDFAHLKVGEAYRRPISADEFSQNNFIFPPGANPEDLSSGEQVTLRNQTGTEQAHAYRGELYFADTHELGAYTVRIFQHRDALRALVRDVIEDEPGVESVVRRELVEQVTNLLLNYAEQPGDARREALEELLADSLEGAEMEPVRQALASRLYASSEPLLARSAEEEENGGARVITDRFAVNLDTVGSDLRRIDEDWFNELHEELPVTLRSIAEEEGEQEESFVPQRSRIWKFVAMVLLIFLAVEMLLATVLTRRQR